MSAKEKKTDKHRQELELRIEQIESENQELLDKLQRLSADYANYQKRVPRQVADSVLYEKKNIVRSLLPSLDNFEHALAAAASAQGPEALENVIKGIRLIFEHLLDALKALGVEKVASQGQPFDPARHEAMMQRSEPDKENGIVLEEYQSCYLLAGDVLRPAKVIVNKRPDQPAAQPESQPDQPDADAIDETTDSEPEVQ